MDDHRSVIARSFALLAATAMAQDEQDQIEIAENYANWILTGEELPEVFDPSTLSMLNGYVMKARAARQTKKHK